MRRSLAVIFCLLLLHFYSCQSEQEVVAPLEGMLTSGSDLAQLLMSVSQSPTEVDNIIDSTSCFRINLPVSLIVNDQPVELLSESGYETVAYIFNQSDSDNDIIEIQFPVSITFENHESVLVSNAAAWETIINTCELHNHPGEIECIDINYPITVNTYDSDSQIAGSLSIANDVQLYNFLDQSATENIMGIVYPVSLTRYDGQILIVDSNLALANAISSVIGSCELDVQN